MRAYSRHRERRVSAAAVLSGVSPGGKSLSREDELLDQAGHEQLSLQPSPGTVLVDLLQVPELQKGFQPWGLRRRPWRSELASELNKNFVF